MILITNNFVEKCAGLRRNEVTKLNHGDVNLENNTLFIRETKFRKSRLLPIKKSTASALSKYIQAKRDAGNSVSDRDALFLNRIGKRISSKAFSHTFIRLTRLTGIKTVPSATHSRPRLHDLRHALLSGHESAKSLNKA
ncbi:MAG: tyrosine-type recombinase/integrase [Deltaproteobacteria bacterium]|nr:tyrosine-type recombinase/integrase [Deltaproteobacteria bacterium]